MFDKKFQTTFVHSKSAIFRSMSIKVHRVYIYYIEHFEFDKTDPIH